MEAAAEVLIVLAQTVENGMALVAAGAGAQQVVVVMVLLEALAVVLFSSMAIALHGLPQVLVGGLSANDT
jgi:hypothetical protein